MEYHAIFKAPGLIHFHAAADIMRLGRQYGESHLEAACARAEHLRACSYRTVKNILARGLDRLPLEEEPAMPTNPMPAHENIRGAAYYTIEEEVPC